MNKQPVETAQDTDLRLSLVAMRRAALRAWEIAARTGTAIVISRNGVIERIEPTPESAARGVHDPAAAYGNKA